jgi:S-DNA-T family DNA segregation ATPase FtsK/SpoIIIE
MALSRKTLGGVLLAAGAVAVLLLIPGLFSEGGPAPLSLLFGWGSYLLAAVLLAGGGWLLLRPGPPPRISWAMVITGELLFLALLTLMHVFQRDPLTAAMAGRGGGFVGWAGSDLLTSLLGPTGARVAALLLTAAAALGFAYTLRPLLAARPTRPQAQTALSGAGRRLNALETGASAALTAFGARIAALRLFQRADQAGTAVAPAPSGGESSRQALSPTRKAPVEAPPAAVSGSRHAPTKEKAAPPKPRPESLPPLDLLALPQSSATGSADARQRAQTLKQTLAEFGVPVEVVSIKEGPTVTQFGLEPGETVRELRTGETIRRRVPVSSIMRLSNDLALALAAQSIRIEAPVPGRPYVGVEIPNSAKTMVGLRGILESKEFARTGSPLGLALGRDVSGDPVVVDLANMPHLLIAGATGSGKSVCINALVSSLLMNNGPERVRFLMVDPKMVELPAYNGIPHLLGPVITDTTQAPSALAWLTLQMDDRYRLFAEQGVRNIAQYNRKFGKGKYAEPLPYLILIIDEMADLMMNSSYDIERQICRLAQMSRATGIHLVIATQRPSVDVVTGLIKANFPARIAFAVTTQIDSRVILDTPGAEKLLGRGDMLFMAPDSAKLARIQGCFVSDREIEGIVSFWKSEDAAAHTAAPWAGLLEDDDATDQLLDQAIAFIRTRSQISTSMLQRQLRIGFPRAARLMEQLEEMGAVGPDEGGGRSREVLIGGMENTN